MSEHNLPSVAVKSHGTQTVAPVNLTVSPEKLADIWDEAPTRRAWWLDLHSSNDFFVGTTISDVEAVVAKFQGGQPGSGVKTDAAPFLSLCECQHPVAKESPFDFECRVCHGVLPFHPAAKHLTQSQSFQQPTLPVCECSQPWPSIKPFDWQCSKCKGVIPSLRDYLEAL